MMPRRARPQGGTRKAGGSGVGGERETYKGHEIVIPRDDAGNRVLVDGEPIRFGRSGNRASGLRCSHGVPYDGRSSQPSRKDRVANSVREPIPSRSKR